MKLSRGSLFRDQTRLKVIDSICSRFILHRLNKQSTVKINFLHPPDKSRPPCCLAASCTIYVTYVLYAYLPSPSHKSANQTFERRHRSLQLSALLILIVELRYTRYCTPPTLMNETLRPWCYCLAMFFPSISLSLPRRVLYDGISVIFQGPSLAGQLRRDQSPPGRLFLPGTSSRRPRTPWPSYQQHCRLH